MGLVEREKRREIVVLENKHGLDVVLEEREHKFDSRERSVGVTTTRPIV